MVSSQVHSDGISGHVHRFVNFIGTSGISDSVKQVQLELAFDGLETGTSELYEVERISNQKVSVYSVNVVFSNECN
jgi:hypothetical protein